MDVDVVEEPGGDTPASPAPAAAADAAGEQKLMGDEEYTGEVPPAYDGGGDTGAEDLDVPYDEAADEGAGERGGPVDAPAGGDEGDAAEEGAPPPSAATEAGEDPAVDEDEGGEEAAGEGDDAAGGGADEEKGEEEGEGAGGEEAAEEGEEEDEEEGEEEEGDNEEGAEEAAEAEDGGEEGDAVDDAAEEVEEAPVEEAATPDEGGPAEESIPLIEDVAEDPDDAGDALAPSPHDGSAAASEASGSAARSAGSVVIDSPLRPGGGLGFTDARPVSGGTKVTAFGFGTDAGENLLVTLQVESNTLGSAPPPAPGSASGESGSGEKNGDEDEEDDDDEDEDDEPEDFYLKTDLLPDDIEFDISGVDNLVQMCLESLLIRSTFRVEDIHLQTMISSVDALQAELQEKGLNRPQMVLLLGRQLMMDLAEEFSVDVPVQVERYKVGHLDWEPMLQRFNTSRSPRRGLKQRTFKFEAESNLAPHEENNPIAHNVQMAEALLDKHQRGYGLLKGIDSKLVDDAMKRSEGEASTIFSDKIERRQTRICFIKEHRRGVMRFLKRLIRNVMLTDYKTEQVEKYLMEVNRLADEMEKDLLKTLSTNDDDTLCEAFGPVNVRWCLEELSDQYWMRSQWPHFDLRARIQAQRAKEFGETSLLDEKTASPQVVLNEIFDQKSYSLRLHAYDLLHAPGDAIGNSRAAGQGLMDTTDLAEMHAVYGAAQNKLASAQTDAAGVLGTRKTADPRAFVWSVNENVEFIYTRCGVDWKYCFQYLQCLSKTLGAFFRLHTTRIVKQEQRLGSSGEPLSGPPPAICGLCNPNVHWQKRFAMKVPKVREFDADYADEIKLFLAKVLYGLMDKFGIKKRSNAGHFYVTKVMMAFHNASEVFFRELEKYVDQLISIGEYFFLRRRKIESIDMTHDLLRIRGAANHAQYVMPGVSLNSWDQEADSTQVFHTL